MPQNLTDDKSTLVQVMVILCLFFAYNLVTDILNISCGLVLEWMPQDHINDKSILVLIMAWCIHATWTNVDQDPRPYKTMLD